MNLHKNPSPEGNILSGYFSVLTGCLDPSLKSSLKSGTGCFTSSLRRWLRPGILKRPRNQLFHGTRRTRTARKPSIRKERSRLTATLESPAFVRTSYAARIEVGYRRRFLLNLLHGETSRETWPAFQPSFEQHSKVTCSPHNLQVFGVLGCQKNEHRARF